jgi:hypothetical protein
VGSGPMSTWQKAIKFGHHVLRLVILVLSIFILGITLFWTLEHTDIIAFVTVLLAATILEIILIFSLFKATSISENNVGHQQTGNRKFVMPITPIMANIERFRFLVSAGPGKSSQ